MATERRWQTSTKDGEHLWAGNDIGLLTNRRMMLAKSSGIVDTSTRTAR
jgi:hypothetical protein